MIWIDATTYSRGQEKTQTAWKCQVNKWLTLIVTCNHIYHPGKWVAYIYPFHRREIALKATTKEEAQQEAIMMARQMVVEVAENLDKMETIR